MTVKQERKRYSKPFRDEAIRLVLDRDYTCAKAGEQLGVPAKTLANWVRPHRKQRRTAVIQRGVEQDAPAALRARVAELEKQLRRAEMEREILPLNVSIPDRRKSRACRQRL